MLPVEYRGVIDPRDVVPGTAAARPEPPAGSAGETVSLAATEGGPPVRIVDLDWRSVAWAMAGFVALVTATGLVGAAPRALTVLAVGTLLALGLDPLVTKVERRLGGRRAAAVAVVMTGLLVAAALIVALLAPRAVDQAQELGGDIDRVVRQVNQLPVIGDDLERAGTARTIERWLEGLPARLSGDDTPLGDYVLRLADGLLVASFTALIVIALLLDGPRLMRAVCRLLPRHRRGQAERIGRLAYETVGRYVAGSLVVACVAGTAVLVAGLVLRVPLAPLLAVWVALFDLVPQIGGAMGGIPFVLLGLTRGAGTAAMCAVFFMLYLQFENNILSPLIVGRAVKLSPLATMTAALVGVSAGGVVGALLAVPVVAAAKVVYVELRPGPTSSRLREEKDEDDDEDEGSDTDVHASS
ncbi:MAG TPA: AI-2E family transporter [Acidimicrobiales bacterium]